MQAGFSSFKKIVTDLYSKYLAILTKNTFDSEHYVKMIGNRIKIMILHSEQDEIIGLHHKDNLIKANNHIRFHKIEGTHNSPVLDEVCVKINEMLQ
ncbi:MAG: hypothetical protein Homavirus4_3 [Homavirus sp.]|uniref:Alpha/beta hydrolase n=1 Tax=Homavirus sp. TaxID=2487769 RepID=A0A3G5A486_9VIRU|nr:MAG: hypothetical protein Homavirus4_3 [Homavirus sp.]